MSDLVGLKVCFLAGALGQGGAERQLYYMLCTLQQHGAEPRVLCLTRGEFWEDRIRELGVPVRWVGANRSRIRRVRQIMAELRANPPDLLQSQHFYTNIYVTAAARALGLREIGALRNNGINEVGEFSRLFGRFSLRAPRVIAANSRSGIENAVTLGVPRSRLRFLPNVVDTSQFTPSRRLDNKAVQLLTVGRMVPQKRFDRFLRTLARVRARSRTPVRGAIVGDGPLRVQLESYAATLALVPSDLQFHAVEPEMASVYQDADVLVLTSDWEGTPNVVLEAMACGLPVVATRVGGLTDILRDGETGRLVEPNDEVGLAAAVLQLVTNSEKRRAYGRRAREFVEQYHALPRLASDLGGLYDAVLH
jgi:glycosyltransferase involved in cell wall biosynthesis